MGWVILRVTSEEAHDDLGNDEEPDGSNVERNLEDQDLVTDEEPTRQWQYSNIRPNFPNLAFSSRQKRPH